MGLKHFKYKETSFSHRPSLTTMVRILPDNRGIVYSDGKSRRNILTFLTPDLKEDYSIALPSTPVQFNEKPDGLYLTTTGNGIFPTDAPWGAVQRWVKNGAAPGYRNKKRQCYLLYKVS